MRKLRLILLAVGIMFLSLVAVFFAIGGGQMVTVMRGPALPSEQMPATPAGDLEYLKKVVLKNERGLPSSSLEEFDSAISSLTATPPGDSDDASIIAARAMAKLDNAHSTLTDPRLHRLPIRVHWFADGLFIIKAAPDWTNLVGLKIVRLGGKAPEQLLERVSELAAGNESWRRYRSEYFLAAPAAIHFLGGEATSSTVTVDTMDPSGLSASFSLKADADVLPGDAFWEWEHQLPGDSSFKTTGWKTRLTMDESLPLYLVNSQNLFLLRDLPEHNAVYLRMNGSINDENMPIRQFAEKSLALVKASHRRNVIVDFRFNWGGGYEETVRLTRDLPKYVPAEGHIYLITGPNTFSAGLIATARLKHFGGEKVIIVGQPAGDNLQFRAEGFLIKLPATQVKVYVSTARHDFQHPIGWLSDCFFLDKFFGVAVDSIAPSIRVENTGESYANGRDEVLETILDKISKE